MRQFVSSVAAFLGVVCLAGTALSADVKVEEQEVGPVAQDAQYFVSPRGGHVATVAHKGSRFAVTMDGVAGPKFDEIRSVMSYVDLRDVVPTQANYKQVVFSNDGSRYAYVGRQGSEFVVITDGKEMMRTTVEHPDQLEVRMQFTGEDGKHLLFAVSGFAGFELWVDGQKMPGVYPSNADPVVSRDGARYAYIAQVARDKSTVVVDGKDAGFVGDNLMFTADGKHLFALVHQGAVTWLAVDGKPKMKTDGISHLFMTSEGNGFAAVLQHLSPPGDFLVVNAKRVAGSDCQSISKVIFSPDGKHFAALCAASPSVKFVLADGKRGQEYFDIPGTTPRTAMTYSPDSSKLGYIAQAANKFYVVINDDESDGFDSSPAFAFSDDSKHVAYAGMVRQPMSFPVYVDGKSEKVTIGMDFETFLFSPDGSRHAYTGRGIVLDGKATNLDGMYSFSPDNKHFVVDGRRGTDNKGGLFVDGKLVYEGKSNFLVRYWAFTPDGQHLYWVAYEPPKDPSTSQGDFVTYLDGKAVCRYDNAPIANASLDRGRIGKDWVKQKSLPSWQVGSDNVLTLVGPVGDVVKRFRVTPASDTSIATLLSNAK